jgi:hypothetical protein
MTLPNPAHTLPNPAGHDAEPRRPTRPNRAHPTCLYGTVGTMGTVVREHRADTPPTTTIVPTTVPIGRTPGPRPPEPCGSVDWRCARDSSPRRAGSPANRDQHVTKRPVRAGQSARRVTLHPTGRRDVS